MVARTALDYPKIRDWKERLEKAGCRVHSIELLQTMFKRDGSLLFALVRADAEDPSGRKLLPLALIRGHACVVVTVVRNRDTGDSRFVMVRQRRIGNGQAGLEFPAGMLDECADPLAVAVRELEEETGLRVRPEELHPLHPEPLYSSPGLDDEGIYYFVCKMELGAGDFSSLQGRVAGLQEEGEHIEVGLWNKADAMAEVTSLQVVLGFHLFAEWERRSQSPQGGAHA